MLHRYSIGSNLNPLRPRRLSGMEEEINYLSCLLFEIPNIALKYIKKRNISITYHPHILYLLKLLIHNHTHLLNAYKLYANDVAERTKDIVLSAYLKKRKLPQIILTISEHGPDIFYELNNFVINSKLLLDNIRLVCPKINGESLPKSITKILHKVEKGDIRTDYLKCIALYKGELQYLINFRDYLVHYGTYGTSSGVCMVSLNAKADIGKKILKFNNIRGPAIFVVRSWRGHFKFNVYLPDAFYENNGSAKIVKGFTYKRRVNLLSWTRNSLIIIGLLISGAICTKYNLKTDFMTKIMRILIKGPGTSLKGDNHENPS